MADLPVVDPLQMTLEEFVERYVVPYYRAKWEAGADEFDRRTCTMINEQANTRP